MNGLFGEPLFGTRRAPAEEANRLAAKWWALLAQMRKVWP